MSLVSERNVGDHRDLLESQTEGANNSTKTTVSIMMVEKSAPRRRYMMALFCDYVPAVSLEPQQNPPSFTELDLL